MAPDPVTERSIGAFLRHALGLSAWKAYGDTRWALRVNPSSGNLHPTEAYLIYGAGVYHYAPREHALEQRAVLPAAVVPPEACLVALTTIHWREAWKYGERAFRYCQHDVGHVLGALHGSAALRGWRMHLLADWPDASIAALTGIDREDDFPEPAECEEAECLLLVSAGPGPPVDRDALLAAVRAASWHGRANRLSVRHVAWPIIDEIARATRAPGAPAAATPSDDARIAPAAAQRHEAGDSHVPNAAAVLRRRSAVAFDARSTLPRRDFLSMLSRLDATGSPLRLLDWPPLVHLVLFIHRVDGLAPGVYAALRDAGVRDEWPASMRDDFLWERVPPEPEFPVDLFLLAPLDVGWIANRLSCDQDIAADGFFSLGMIARLESAVRARGEWVYRRLFWECGLIGQVLYLEAELVGARGTGIGCFYDDAVHEVLGLQGAEWQSLYHFSMGVPVEDPRLTTEPGYAWERATGEPREIDLSPSVL